MSKIPEKYESVILALEQERKKLSIIANMTANLIFEYDIASQTMYYTNNNAAWQSEDVIIDYAENLLKGDIIWYEDKKTAISFCQDLDAGKDDIFVEFRWKFPNGQYRWIEVKAKTLKDELGKPILVLGQATDINERKQKELFWKKLSRSDSLTGLYNQNTIKKKITKALSQKETTETGALFVVDIDFFKQINDSYGHLFGDAVLCSVADEMKHIFPKNALLGRIGGDEFLAYIEKTTKKEAEDFAKQICFRIHNIYKEKEEAGKVKISCSVGVSLTIGEEKDYATLFSEADRALYFVKENGKGKYEVFDKGKKYTDTIESEEEESLSLTDNFYAEDEKATVTHNLLLFSIELLEKTSDTKQAIHMILDRVGRYFDLDGIALVIRDGKGLPHTQLQWTKKGMSEMVDRKVPYSKEQLSHILSLYDEFGMAVIRGKDTAVEGVYEPDIETILTLKSHLDDQKKGDIAFVDAFNNREWSVEEKAVMKGLATILYSHIAKTNAKANTKRAEYLIRYDAVTGLPNYTTFKDMADEITANNPGECYAIAYSGFSNFQYVNDNFGYATGDKILTQFGNFLLKDYKYSMVCSRITGDQFVLLLKCDDLQEAGEEYIASCKRFCNQMKQEIGLANLVVISGICIVEDESIHRIATTIDNANLARKTIHKVGETDCLAFTLDLKKLMDEKIRITTTMSSALENKEFKVFLQPKIDIKSGDIVGAEALVRWQQADGTMVYPDSFIPVFEENGFITKIDFYVLRRVLEYLKERKDQGLKVIPISVNFSRRHQENPQFVNDILDLLKEYDLPKELIEVEVTESVFMDNMDLLNSNVSQLKEKGIAISIDDFGSGYSSLNVLTSVPADVIKIDRVFLKDTDQKTQNVLKYLIQMIQSMNFKVIVEGVETEEQLSMLKDLNCDMAQGYYYSRPMPMELFEKFLA